jgi:hypothetical protein
MKSTIIIGLFAFSVVPASAQLYGSQPSSSGLYGTGSNPSSHYVQPHTNSNGHLYIGPLSDELRRAQAR